MPQPQDVFRLVSLRGPDTSRSVGPAVESRVESVAALVDLGRRLRSGGDAEQVPTEIRALDPPRSVRGIRSLLPWFDLAQRFALNPAADVSGWEIRVDDDRRDTLAEYVADEDFQHGYDELVVSWMTLKLREQIGRPEPAEVVQAHEAALKFAAVMRRVAAGPLRPGEGSRLFARGLVVPIPWRRPAAPGRTGVGEPLDEPAEVTAADRLARLLGAEPSEHLNPAGSSEEGAAAAAAVAAPATAMAARPAEDDDTGAEPVTPEQLLSDARLLHQIRVKAAVLFDSGEVPTTDFEADFVDTLEAKLSDRGRAVLRSFVGGHHYSDFTDLFDDLEANAEAKLVTANELCRKLRVFEDDAEQSLPTARTGMSKNRPSIRALGWGDLMVVREELVGYEAGEISHIENVLAGESTSKRHDRRHETRVLTETETVSETSTENQLATTDRFEIQGEAASAITSDFSVAAGVNTSGKYGLTNVQTSVAGELSRTSEDSTRSAMTTAQEVVSNAVTRTREMARELRRTVTTDSLRELNVHSLDNTKTAVDDPQPRSGIYQWVNKVQRLQLYQYGKRMMIEFAIPEPGLSLIEAGQPVRPDVPKPLPLGVGPADITEGNYLCLADKYHARDVSPPPPPLIQIGEAFATQPNYADNEKSAGATAEKELPVPQGYEPISGRYAATGRGTTQTSPTPPPAPNAPPPPPNAPRPETGLDWFHVHLAVGGELVYDSVAHRDDSGVGPGGKFSYDGSFVLTAPTVTDDHGLPITVRWTGPDDNIATLNVYIRCRRGAAALTSWRLDTYERLLAAHDELQSAYEEASAQARYVDSTEATFGDRPSEQNRAIERDELKKWAVKLMRTKPFTFDAVISEQGVQEVDAVAADEQAPVVRFFEQCFEWDQMTYLLEPYFWGRRDSWKLRQKISVPSDPRHEAFLKAGSARVIVPVTAGDEARLLAYLESDPHLPEWDPDVDVENWNPNSPTQRIPPTPRDLASTTPADVLNTTFPDLWLELIDDYKPDLLRGSGKVRVTKGDPAAALVGSVERLESGRDVGREIYIDADRYVIVAVTGPTAFTLNRPYARAGGDLTYATGSVKRGEPWEIRVPTSLLVLSPNRDDLSSIP